MENFRAAMVIVKCNFVSWRNDDKIIAIFGTLIILLISYVGKLTVYSFQNQGLCTPWIFSFLFADGIHSNGSFKVLAFFGIIVLFCDAPFWKPYKIYFLVRSKRTGWWMGECLYIVLSSLIYLLVIILFCFLVTLPCITFSNDWGSIVQEAAVNGEVCGQIFSGVHVNSYLIGQTTPAEAAWYTFFTVWADMVFLGFLIACINLYSKKDWMGVFCAVFFVLIDVILRYFKNDFSRYLLLFSPINWCSMQNLNRVDLESYLTIDFVGSALTLILLILVCLIARKSRKMDIPDYFPE